MDNLPRYVGNVGNSRVHSRRNSRQHGDVGWLPCKGRVGGGHRNDRRCVALVSNNNRAFFLYQRFCRKHLVQGRLYGCWFSALLVCASLDVALFTDFNVIFIILIGGALGVLYTLLCDVVAKRKARKLPLQQNECLPEQDNERNDSDGGEVK